jgi:hypothetical protein
MKALSPRRDARRGWYSAGESAGFVGGVVGAIIVLAIYGFFAGRQGRAAWSTSVPEKVSATLVCPPRVYVRRLGQTAHVRTPVLKEIGNALC